MDTDKKKMLVSIESLQDSKKKPQKPLILKYQRISLFEFGFSFEDSLKVKSKFFLKSNLISKKNDFEMQIILEDSENSNIKIAINNRGDESVFFGYNSKGDKVTIISANDDKLEINKLNKVFIMIEDNYCKKNIYWLGRCKNHLIGFKNVMKRSEFNFFAIQKF